MGMPVLVGCKRVSQEGCNEQKEEEKDCNGCLRHANEGVCVLLLFVLKDTFSTYNSTEN